MKKYTRYTQALILAVIALGCNPDRPATIGIQPLGVVGKTFTDIIAAALKSEYGAHVSLLPMRQLPPETFINAKTPRYRADKLIKILRDDKPDSLDLVIGITYKDISITNVDALGQVKKPESKYADWGVFGYGYCPGKSSIVSTQRLRTPNKSRLLQRLKKIAIHEVGHNLGLAHCTNTDCVMQDAAETIRTIDAVNGKLCAQCRQKIE